MKITDKILIWLFKEYLNDYKVIEVKGFGVFLVETKAGQRMTIYIDPQILIY